MIGYVQTDTNERWHGELQKRVQDEAGALSLETLETFVQFMSAFPLEWASTHRREGLGLIKLFHIPLDCRKQEHA